MKIFDTRESVMYEDSSSASTSSSRNSSRNSSIYDETTIGDELFTFSNSNGSNLAATLTSMRSNVTRLLNMFFQNVSSNHDDDNDDVVQQQQNVALTIAGATTTIPQRISNAITTVTKAAKTLNVHFIKSTSASSLSSSLTAPTNSSTSSSLAATAKTATAATSLRNITPDAELLNGTLHTSTLRPIIYPSFREAIRSSDNCSTLFANYTRPQEGKCSSVASLKCLHCAASA